MEALVALEEITDPLVRLSALSIIPQTSIAQIRTEYRDFVRRTQGAIRDRYKKLESYGQFKELVEEGRVADELRILVRERDGEGLAILSPVLSRSQLEFALRELGRPAWLDIPPPFPASGTCCTRSQGC